MERVKGRLLNAQVRWRDEMRCKARGAERGNLRKGGWSRGHMCRRTGDDNESEETWKNPEDCR